MLNCRIVHYIVPRMSGKTTRIKQMINSSKADRNILVVPNDNIRRMYERDLRRLSNVHIMSINNFKLDNYRGRDFDKVNVYFDELLHMIDNHRVDIISVLDYMMSMCDSLHSNVIAFSTPMRKYKLSEYVKWISGLPSIDTRHFEQGLLSAEYISYRLPFTQKEYDFDSKFLKQAGNGTRSYSEFQSEFSQNLFI